MLRNLFVIITCVVVIGSMDTRAAEPAADSSSTSQIEEITVTARFREESAQDVPLAISAFSANDMERLQMDTTYDLQYHTPGLFATQGISAATGASLVIRGQSAADSLMTTDSSVGVYVDGISVPRFLGLDTSLFDIARVEVLKGPQGTLFGRNTTGGAISFVTKKADYDGLHGFAAAEGGSFGTFDLSGAVNVPLIDNEAALRLAAKSVSSDGWGNSSGNGQKINDDTERFARANLTLDPTESLNIEIGGEYQRFKNNGSPYISQFIGTGLVAANAALEGLNPVDQQSACCGHNLRDFNTAFDGGTTQPNIQNYARYNRQAANATVSWDFADDMTLRSISGWHNFNSSRSFDLDGTSTSGAQVIFHTTADFYSQELQLLGKAFDDKLDWVSGAYWSREQGIDHSESYLFGTLGGLLSPIGIPVPVFNGDIENTSWAVFTQGDYNFTDQLRLTLGYRYTNEGKNLESSNHTVVGLTGEPVSCSVPNGTLTDCRFSTHDNFDGDAWLVSLDYRFAEGVMTYIRSSHGFKGGGQNLRGSPEVLSFSAVKPEKATDIEWGVKSNLLDDHLELNANVWYTKYDDIQRSVNVEVNGFITSIIKNAANASMHGVEFSSTWVVTDEFSLTATGNYFDGSYDEWDDLDATTGAPIDRSDTDFTMPKYAYDVMARWQQAIRWGMLDASVDYYWQDDAILAPDVVYTLPISDPARQDPDRVTQDAYGLLNARIALELNDGIEVAVFGRNLLDEQFFTAMSDNSLTVLGSVTGLAGPPRFWGVSLKKSLGE